MMAQTPLLERDPSSVPAEMRIGVTVAAKILGVSERTVERWVDAGTLVGDRPRDRAGEIIPLSHRWIDARDAVWQAVNNYGRAHLIPESWRHLVRAVTVPQQPSGQ